MEIRVKPVSHEDCILLHSWLNDPFKQRMTLNPGQLPTEVFKRWFRVLIGEKDVLLLIAELIVNGQWVSMAQLRIHTDGEIGISIHEEYRGKHLATPVILASLDFVKYNPSINRVFARIRCDNTPSIRAFKRAGFYYMGDITIKNYQCVEYAYELARMAG